MNQEEILNMPAGRKMNALIQKHVTKGIHPTKYSTNITAAWEVVEELKLIYPFRISFLNEEIPENIKWQLEKFEVGWYASFAGAQYVPVYAETAPLAICRAALLAVVPAQQGGV